MTWKVDPAGVQTLLTSVSTEAEPIGTALGKVDGAVQGAATAAQSEVIAKAIEQFFTAVTPSITTIQQRIPAAIDGAAAATTAIIDGDEQMAAQAEAAAVTAGTRGDFSPFQAGGVFGGDR